MRKALFALCSLVAIQNAYGSWCDCLPSCAPCFEGEFHFNASWIYWRPTQDRLNYAFETANFQDPDAGIRDVAEANGIRPNFQYKNGFKLGLAYLLPNCPVEIGLFYTQLNSSDKNHFIGSSIGDPDSIVVNSPIFPLLAAFEDSFFTDLSQKWHLNFNYGDIDFAYPICIDECIEIKPHVGARILWLDQEVKANGSGFEFSEPLSPFTYNLRFKESTFAYGVEGGLLAEWRIGCGFSLVGHCGGAILYSRYRLKQETVQISTGAVLPDLDGLVAIEQRDVVSTATPMFDAYLGLKYTTCIYDRELFLSAGWEQHVLIDANQLANGGNLALQGLTVTAGVTF